MKKKLSSNLIYKISLILCGFSLLVLGGEISSYWQQKNRITEIAKNNAKQEAVRASKQLEEKLRKVQDVANAIATDINQGKLDDEQLLNRAKKDLEQNPDLGEVGVIYQTFAYNPKRRLYAPYYMRKKGKIERIQIEDYYDYTKPENSWFYQALQKGSVWNEPEFDESSNAIVADYFVTFRRPDSPTKQRTPTGLIYANLSLEKLKSLINSLEVGKSGYGVLISKKGALLVHPNQQYVKDGKSLFDLAKERKNEQLQFIGEKATNGESAVIDWVDDITGQAAWVFTEPISLNGWSLAVVVIKDDSAVDFKTNRRQLIRIALETILFLFLLSVVIWRPHAASTRSLWVVSTTFSVLCAIGIGFIWHLILAEQNYKNNRNVLLSKATVDNLLEPKFKLAQQLNQKPPLEIPTGVLVQSVKFNSANDVFVSGYVWQKYTDGLHDGLSRGFILPEGYEVDINEAYRSKKDKTELIGWYFEANLRQSFDFSKYPFDYNDVWVRLWPKDFQRRDLNRNLILVPDLSAYEVVNPVVKPGLVKDFVSETWNVESSFFEYKFNSYNTNFGFQDVGPRKDYPELYFTVILERAFIGILIARIVPLTVVAILLFIMKLLSRDRGLDVVAACAGLIFIVILDQISMRGQIAAKGLIYFEYFYFVIYVFVLLVSVNAILLNSESKFPLVQYRNNLIPKLFYWPTLLGTLLAISTFMFY